MKKSISIVLTLLMVLSLCACGKKENVSDGPKVDENIAEATDETAPENTAEAEVSQEDVTEESSTSKSVSDEEKQMQEDMDELSKLGDVEVENGILTVSITLPAAYMEGVTQEDLDAGKGTTYQSATLNDDGSVTFKMTKQQHKDMMKSMTDSMDQSIQEMIDDDNYTITGVTHNEDCTVFDVTLEGTEVGFSDSFTSVVFYMYGGMYGIFSGKEADHVVVNFLDPDGNLIESYDSANMES